jgi:hypothetical protein
LTAKARDGSRASFFVAAGSVQRLAVRMGEFNKEIIKIGKNLENKDFN